MRDSKILSGLWLFKNTTQLPSIRTQREAGYCLHTCKPVQYINCESIRTQVRQCNWAKENGTKTFEHRNESEGKSYIPVELGCFMVRVIVQVRETCSNWH